MKKVIKYVFFTFIFLFLGISNVFAALPDNAPIIYESNSRNLDRSNSYANGHTTSSIFNAGSYSFFCTHLQVGPPYGKQCTKIALNNSKAWTIPTSAAIGELTKTVLKDKSDKSYYYFGIAINMLIYEKGEGDNDNYTSREGNQQMYYDYMNIMNNKYNSVKNELANLKSSPKISASNSVLSFSNNSYNTNITVSNCNSCTVSTNKGTITKKDANGVGNGTYVLSVPASSIKAGQATKVDVTVSDTNTVKYDIARNYYCGADVQTVTPLATEEYTKSVSGKASVSVNANRTQLVFKKTNAKTGNIVPGGSFILTKGNQQIDEITSGTSTYTDIENGEYCIIEKEAPVGYTNMKEKKCVTLSNNNLNESITISDDLTSIKIKKIDSKTKKALDGAKLVIVDKDDNVVSTINDEECSWTSTDDYISFYGLPIGTYYIKELEAPDGYTLIDNPVEFTIEEDGKVVTSKEENLSDDSIIVVENKLTKVDISKQDATTGKELPGAHLQILDEDDNVVKEWISTDTPHRVEGLKAGRYKLKETIAPSGYQKTETTVEFTIYSDGKTEQVVMKNEPIKVYVPSTAKNASIILSIVGLTFVVVAGMIFLYKEGIIKLPQNKK